MEVLPILNPLGPGFPPYQVRGGRGPKMRMALVGVSIGMKMAWLRLRHSPHMALDSCLRRNDAGVFS